jgi:hypothetical protein
MKRHSQLMYNRAEHYNKVNIRLTWTGMLSTTSSIWVIAYSHIGYSSMQKMLCTHKLPTISTNCISAVCPYTSYLLRDGDIHTGTRISRRLYEYRHNSKIRNQRRQSARTIFSYGSLSTSCRCEQTLFLEIFTITPKSSPSYCEIHHTSTIMFSI